MPGHRHRIVIVGAGHAGGVAAMALRDAGFAGLVTVVGNEAWPPYERPPLSKDLLSAKMAVDRTFLRASEHYAERGIDLVLGCAVEHIERDRSRVTLADRTVLPYDSLLLATGTRSRSLNVPGADHPRVHYLRAIEDSLKLRRQLVRGTRLVVIGSGLIGLEVAATARELGCSVVILGQAAHPLARVAPPDVGRIFTALHSRNGVDIRTETVVTEIKGKGDCVVVHTDDASEIDADIVVAGIGALPNTALGEAAGLEVSDGIVTDEYGRTSDPNIYAAGDAARAYHPQLGRHVRLETWQNAQNQALAVAKAMLGGREPYVEVPWFWTDQYDLNFQSAGDPDACDQLVWRGQPGKSRSTLFYLQCGRITGAACFNNGRDMRLIKQLIARCATAAPEKLADPAVRLADLFR